MFDLVRMQSAIREFGFEGWLLYDFRESNILARRVLQLPDSTHTSRRFACFIPAEGKPRRLVHRIESGVLDHIPGEKTVYLRWQEFEAGIATLIGGAQRIAMEYAPRNSNPYISRVDAGTVELVRSFGAEIGSSGDLVQLFEAVWDESQWQMHEAAGQVTNAAFSVAWTFIADAIRDRGVTTEWAVQQAILEHFEDNNLTTYSPPIVGVNAHSGDPHYETGMAEIRQGDFVLVDLWGKLKEPRAVYSDLTRTGFVGESVPEKYDAIFQIVARARDAAIQTVRDAFAAGRTLPGWQVDDACRKVIEEAGYGQYFVHRTGHSIGQEVHGNGANIDNLETHEERLILPGCCFSIEPGIYLPEFGVRSEVDVFVNHQRQVQVTGGALQTEVVPILKQY